MYENLEGATAPPLPTSMTLYIVTVTFTLQPQNNYSQRKA